MWVRVRRIETRQDRSFAAFLFDDARIRMLQKMRQPARRPSAYPRATSSRNQALLTADAVLSPRWTASPVRPCLSCWYTQPLCWHVDRGEYEQEAHNQIDQGAL